MAWNSGAASYSRSAIVGAFSAVRPFFSLGRCVLQRAFPFSADRYYSSCPQRASKKRGKLLCRTTQTGADDVMYPCHLVRTRLFLALRHLPKTTEAVAHWLGRKECLSNRSNTTAVNRPHTKCSGLCVEDKAVAAPRDGTAVKICGDEALPKVTHHTCLGSHQRRRIVRSPTPTS